MTSRTPLPPRRKTLPKSKQGRTPRNKQARTPADRQSRTPRDKGLATND